MASCRQSKSFLECIEDNLLSQVVEGPTRVNAVLDQLLTNASKLIGDIRIGGCLCCSGYAVVEFMLQRDMR